MKKNVKLKQKLSFKDKIFVTIFILGVGTLMIFSGSWKNNYFVPILGYVTVIIGIVLFWYIIGEK